MRLIPNFRNFLCIAAIATCAGVPVIAQAQMTLEPVVTGLDTPWAVAPLPEGGALVTLREGTLIHSLDGTNREITGVPRVADSGQGGLLDITLARDFERTRTLFLTYATPQAGRGSGTALASAIYRKGGTRLEDVKELFEMKAGSSGGRHFGSRVVEGTDGTLFMTIGDRGDRPAAQDLRRHNGSVIRVNRDGSVPKDNPFVGRDAVLPEIWSYGHRNPQGAGLDLQGNLWVSEHGARGGDEVNRVKRGANYGWPVISYGVHYSGGKIGEGTAKEGMEQPALYWDPSIAPSGLLVYSGKMFPDWRGQIFVGSLKFDYISRLAGNPLREVEQIKTPQTSRVRDIVEAPDGSIWFLSVGDGAVYRIAQ
ncbi:Glucose dehydrogenase [Sulfitobacter noctilucicola]|uniref:Glucose/arabinose dehydrogenase n=1 Tax=Sulfitobacter noctilucicola TaxID=1342301 RepID=A0A7W6M9B3_9RHOB|nr:PQQ-dependent sugar dehydrogenase [Sulfitobacter noctilucicola]KIN65004.1 Glucose dehydrogenase [Sulfitobacter noctilucicola]MBB4173856.1 glucose/arabinose dehydrogenase [Sulfitobacter noctilucicola]